MLLGFVCGGTWAQCHSGAGNAYIFDPNSVLSGGWEAEKGHWRVVRKGSGSISRDKGRAGRQGVGVGRGQDMPLTSASAPPGPGMLQVVLC